MNFKRDYILESKRVLLRPLEEEDIPHLEIFSLTEPDLWKYSLQSASGQAKLEQYVSQAINHRMQEKEYPFIVFDKSTQLYAGCTRFYDIQIVHQTLQLGFTWYGKAFQGTGLNQHCKYLLLQLAFEQLNIKRVEFRADAENFRSIAAMKKIGCTLEGTLRSHSIRSDGTRRDSVVLSILQEDWFLDVKQSLEAQL
jgi:N-acetyltransferase